MAAACRRTADPVVPSSPPHPSPVKDVGADSPQRRQRAAGGGYGWPHPGDGPAAYHHAHEDVSFFFTVQR